MENPECPEPVPDLQHLGLALHHGTIRRFRLSQNIIKSMAISQAQLRGEVASHVSRCSTTSVLAAGVDLADLGLSCSSQSFIAVTTVVFDHNLSPGTIDSHREREQEQSAAFHI
jgi:hypothetical protein